MTTAKEKALAELTHKIQKHCPELLELSFGCVVEATNGYEYTYLCRFVKDDQHWYLNDVGAVCNDVRNNPKENGLIAGKILGHPITLEHVLKAIGEEKRNEIIADTLECNLEYLTDRWELCKPLSDQSPQTIEWLNTIIE